MWSKNESSVTFWILLFMVPSSLSQGSGWGQSWWLSPSVWLRTLWRNKSALLLNDSKQILHPYPVVLGLFEERSWSDGDCLFCPPCLSSCSPDVDGTGELWALPEFDAFLWNDILWTTSARFDGAQMPQSWHCCGWAVLLKWNQDAIQWGKKITKQTNIFS